MGSLDHCLHSSDVQLVKMLVFCTETNSQHLLEEVPMQVPGNSMPGKEYQIVREESFVGGSDGQ